MKKLSWFLLSLALTAGVAMAENDKGVLVGGGVSLNGVRQEFTQNFSEDSGTLSAWERRTYGPLLARVFATAEIPYLTVDAGLGYQIGTITDPQSYVTVNDASTNFDAPKGLLQADLSAFFRYDLPVNETNLTNFLVGGRLDLNLLAADKADMSTEAKDNLNNFWLMGGFGYRTTLSATLAFRWNVMVGYDLTAMKSSTTIPGYTKTSEKYTGLAFDATAALLYRL